MTSWTKSRALRPLACLTASLTVAVLLAGCTMEDEGGARTTDTTPTTREPTTLPTTPTLTTNTTATTGTTMPTTNTTGTAPPGEAASVEITGAKFAPQNLTVTAGTTVSWRNNDNVSHDVTGEFGDWQSTGGPGGLAPGWQYAMSFDEAGTYRYYCTVHSTGPGAGMWGSIVVT